MIKAISSLVTFLFIFSFFNDNFLVENIGSNGLKAIFMLFIMFNFLILIKYFKISFQSLKFFYLFLFSSFFLLLIQTFIGIVDSPSTSLLKFFAIASIVIFFSYYNLKESLYFTWISIQFSIILCYLSNPINEWTFRKTGGTGDPNEFALHVLIFIAISVYLFKTNRSKIFIIISIISFFYGLFFAGSMTSFIVFFALSFIYVLLNMKKSTRYILLILLIVPVFVDFSKIDVLNNVINRSNNLGTANTRLESWKAGINMFQNNPIVGVGINNYVDNTLKYSDIHLNSDAIAPHNILIKLLAESGIIIFILFIFLIMNLIFKDLISIIKTDYIFILFSTLSLLLMSLSIGIVYDNYFWFILALYINTKKLFKKDYNENFTYHP